MKSNGRLGIFLTILLVSIAILVLHHRELISLYVGLTPNEVGDFLAGIFAPIALCWLVLGYYQQAKELKENTDALKKQGEEANKHTEAFNKQLEIFTSQLYSHERSVFFDSYNIRYNELAFRAASIVRATLELDRWDRTLDMFGKGYIDAFCNTLKNERLNMGNKGFLKKYDECFSDNRGQLYYYVTTYENFLIDAEKIDSNVRRILEMSGLGTAYVSICSLLKHEPKLNFRNYDHIEKGPLVSVTGTRGKNA